VKQGSYCTNNTWRASTRMWENTWELYYYGHRYYSPDLGAWLTRDPGEELAFRVLLLADVPSAGSSEGVPTDFTSPGLYGYVENQPTMKVDALGLTTEGATPTVSVRLNSVEYASGSHGGDPDGIFGYQAHLTYVGPAASATAGAVSEEGGVKVTVGRTTYMLQKVQIVSLIVYKGTTQQVMQHGMLHEIFHFNVITGERPDTHGVLTPTPVEWAMYSAFVTYGVLEGNPPPASTQGNRDFWSHYVDTTPDDVPTKGTDEMTTSLQSFYNVQQVDLSERTFVGQPKYFTERHLFSEPDACGKGGIDLLLISLTPAAQATGTGPQGADAQAPDPQQD
jgi:RHS repeat-associated protein